LQRISLRIKGNQIIFTLKIDQRDFGILELDVALSD